MRWQPSLLRFAQQAGACSRAAACQQQQQQQWTSCLLTLSQHDLHTWHGPTAIPRLPATDLQPTLSLNNFQPRRDFFSLPGSQDLSKHYRERRLIGYTPDQLYQVVSNVEEYDQFVPWCERSRVLERRDDTYMEAELEVGFKVFVERYTSKIDLTKNKLVLTRVADSTLFSSLDNRWEFEEGPTANSCWLTFSIDFAFKSPLYGQLATVFFKEVVQRMMGAFEQRCKHQYGESSFNPKKGFQRTAPAHN